jgi:hypothetical protein
MAPMSVKDSNRTRIVMVVTGNMKSEGERNTPSRRPGTRDLYTRCKYGVERHEAETSTFAFS